MSLLESFWSRICEPLDGFLWHKDISHPIIRPLLRNEILAAGACVLLGGCLFLVFPWLFWFGCGLLCIVWIFWSWTRFFGRLDPADLGGVFFRAFFLNFGVRLLIFALLLYFAIAYLRASISALLAGFTGGAFLALASYAIYLRRNPGN